MAIKAGDRVRRIGGARGATYYIVPEGAEGTVLRWCAPANEWGAALWDVRWDLYGNWNAVEDSLAPLTPPAEDTWASEQVKKWTKPEPNFQPSTREVFEHYKSLQTD